MTFLSCVMRRALHVPSFSQTQFEPAEVDLLTLINKTVDACLIFIFACLEHFNS